MDILSFLKLDPKLWPFAVLAFLRIVTIFYFLPIIGNKAVPTQLRVALAIVITFTLWPFIADSAEKNTDNFHWDVWTLAVLTVQEVFFGFTFCFAAKFIIFAISIMSNLVGVNMGFHAASMFNPNTEDRESSFSALANWIVLVLIVLLNIPQFFLMKHCKIFYYVTNWHSCSIRITYKKCNTLSSGLFYSWFETLSTTDCYANFNNYFTWASQQSHATIQCSCH